MIDEKKFLEEENNMIDARKIYKYIKAEINPYGKPFEGTVFEFGCKVMDYIEAMEKQPKTDWIPCEERLPDKRGNYLVCSKGVTWVANWFLNTWWGIEKRCRFSDVEAWQPLPQAYKKEGAE